MADSLKGLFKACAGPGPSLIQGSVIGLAPLRVQAVNDNKLIISSASLVIPSRITNLEIGDRLHILVLQNGKKYYVLDRV